MTEAAQAGSPRGGAGPLSGLRVLDTSSLAPGNYATLILARSGAEVIKLERPSGDPIRGMRSDQVDPFIALNAGKKSVVVDLKEPEGQRAFDRLIALSDVIVENYLPDTARRLGVTFERISAVNASTVLCSVTGYGETSGRYSAPGHDLNFWAESGALAFMQPDGQAPLLPVSDLLGGVAAAAAISSALYQRAVTGVGDHVRISLADTMLHAWVGLGLNPLAQGPHKPTAGYAVYTAADGRQLAVAVEEQHYWHSFCEAIEHPELQDADHLDYGKAGLLLRERVQGIIGGRTIEHWLEVLSAEHNLPVNEVLDAHGAAQSALRRREPIIQQDDAGVLIPQSLFSSARFRPEVALRAPLLGEHTEEYLGDGAGR